MNSTSFLETVRELSDRLVRLQKPIRVLDAVNWGPEIRAGFFNDNERRKPPVTPDYYAGRPLRYSPDELKAGFLSLERDITRRVGQLHPIGTLMRRMCREYRIVMDMLEARGQPEFPGLAAELYGLPGDVFHAGEPSLAELGMMLEETLGQMAGHALFPDEPHDLDAPAAVAHLSGRLRVSMPGIPVTVEVSDGIVSDAAAGSDRIKLNAEARFSMRVLEILEVHEGWIHLGTTWNGQNQPWLGFLAKGTPAAVVTQEGLAVLTEILTLKSTPERLSRLVGRIRALTLAGDGATFLDVYNYFRDRGVGRDEAYTVAARAFRGSLPEAGPFTKDLSYIKGFVLIYNFIRVAVQLGRLDRLPILMAGKINLDDFKLYADLYDQELIVPPAFLPPHFADFRGLASWLSFSRFMYNLSFETLEQEYRHLF